MMKDRPSRQAAWRESRREREFYKYYQPIRDLSGDGPGLCDLYDDEAAKNHRPRSCPDSALTAFCQLGALRMGTRRALLFFFDLKYAYVLAEATRSLSLQDDSIHDFEDHLWLGHTIIPRGLSVCESTVMMPDDPGGSQGGQSLVHIVNDLSSDTRFCDRPYVKDGPRAKFYAGVPITTPRGINIGAYCVLDDKVRTEPLSDKEMQFLRDMSATVMSHLEMVRANSELARGARMVAGLGSFLDGASRFRERAQRDIPKAVSRPEPLTPEGPPGKADAPPENTVETLEVIQYDQQPPQPPQSKEHNSQKVRNSHDPKAPETLSHSVHRSLSRRNAATVQGEGQNLSNEQALFHIATAIVRDAIEVDGVAFLDTSTTSFRNLVESAVPPLSSGGEQDAAVGSSRLGNSTEPGRGSNINLDKLTEKPCRTFASAVSPPAHLLPSMRRNSTGYLSTLREGTLGGLLRNHPKGKIWYFNDLGNVSDDASASEASESDSDGELGSEASPSQRRKREQAEEIAAVHAAFPEARSIAVVGMWDHNRGRWYAACAFWSYSPLRLFSEEFEVKYVSAFCDVILAELHRLEAETSDRAKSDFISTISHELRSPLHGILGTVECLQEGQIDPQTSDLVAQIELCGRTLVDIIDHLLDFSKINHQTKSRTGWFSPDKNARSNDDTSAQTTGTGFMASDDGVALDRITEETVETAVYSFCCSRDPESILKRKVDVILDIDRPDNVDWRCNVATGAWKRIVINLVSNALKYTHDGHIRVSLSATPSKKPDGQRCLKVIFSVRDSGRGMSSDFLKKDLFRAFSQEDSFIEGTGLGLNLVAKIVKALDGQIDVESEKNIGSIFSITLSFDQNTALPAAAALEKTLAGSPLRDVVIGVIAPLDNNEARSAMGTSTTRSAGGLVIASIIKAFEQAGAQTLESGWSNAQVRHVNVVLERDVLALTVPGTETVNGFAAAYNQHFGETPLIVVCATQISLRRLKASGANRLSRGHVTLVAQPAGRERLVKAARACMTWSKPDTIPTPNAATTAPRVAEKPEPSNESSPSPPPPSSRGQADMTASTSSLEGATHVNPSAVGLNLNLNLTINVQNETTGEITQRKAATPMSLQSAQPHSGEVLVGITAKATGTHAHAQHVPILVVDDNPINVQLLKTYLQKRKHRSATATNGLEAVAAYKQACMAQSGADAAFDISARYRVILMDINMPVLDGFEATRRIRDFEKEHQIEPAIIIALTGLGSAGAQEEAFASGFDLFLTKPVRLKELAKILGGLE